MAKRTQISGKHGTVTFPVVADSLIISPRVLYLRQRVVPELAQEPREPLSDFTPLRVTTSPESPFAVHSLLSAVNGTAPAFIGKPYVGDAVFVPVRSATPAYYEGIQLNFETGWAYEATYFANRVTYDFGESITAHFVFLPMGSMVRGTSDDGNFIVGSRVDYWNGFLSVGSLRSPLIGARVSISNGGKAKRFLSGVCAVVGQVGVSGELVLEDSVGTGLTIFSEGTFDVSFQIFGGTATLAASFTGCRLVSYSPDPVTGHERLAFEGGTVSHITVSGTFRPEDYDWFSALAVFSWGFGGTVGHTWEEALTDNDYLGTVKNQDGALVFTKYASSAQAIADGTTFSLGMDCWIATIYTPDGGNVNKIFPAVWLRNGSRWAGFHYDSFDDRFRGYDMIADGATWSPKRNYWYLYNANVSTLHPGGTWFIRYRHGFAEATWFNGGDTKPTPLYLWPGTVQLSLGILHRDGFTSGDAPTNATAATFGSVIVMEEVGPVGTWDVFDGATFNMLEEYVPDDPMYSYSFTATDAKITIRDGGYYVRQQRFFIGTQIQPSGTTIFGVIFGSRQSYNKSVGMFVVATPDTMGTTYAGFGHYYNWHTLYWVNEQGVGFPDDQNPHSVGWGAFYGYATVIIKVAGTHIDAYGIDGTYYTKATKISIDVSWTPQYVGLLGVSEYSSDYWTHVLGMFLIHED